jgi:hypothetical protein
MTILTFAMELRRMSSLPRVLMLCQRLGAQVTYLSAAEGSANLVLAAPPEAAHRFAPQLRRIIDVVELTELHSRAQSSPARAV